jgi:hypothetical protein
MQKSNVFHSIAPAAALTLGAAEAHATDTAETPHTRAVSKTVTHANGKTTNVDKSLTATPTQNGKTWTRNRTVTGARGGTHSSQATGSVTRNGDGSRTSVSHKDVSGTTARGRAYQGSVDKSAKIQHTASGRVAERTVKRTESAP